ncbi:hypothetical protein F444_13549 [Phytophthora nicotianae P1976]|uniref:Uncharacterized protein n=1 Tax=Phytophthora nicotianae P1976 TaxID=1317066 RepID=A0A080ZTH3_PHYNI|nr:hypothetical protein F444_13549 [Phytophthora nicotianae P1976]
MEKVPDRKERAKILKRKNQSKNAYYKKRSRRPQYQAQAAPYRIGKQIYHAANIVPRLMGSCSENAEFIPESRGDDDGSSPPMLYTSEDWHSGNGDVPYDVVQWPANIERLHQYFNPNDIKFDFTPAFDPAFGGLVQVAMAVAERFRVAVSRDGIRLAMSLLAECDGDLHRAQKLTRGWNVERKSQELTTTFQRWFPLYKPNIQRNDREEEQARVVFFDTAMTTWLQIAQDLSLFGGKDGSSDDLPDAAALKRYDSQTWQRRICPPPASIGDLCVHINSLEGYLRLPHLGV